MPNKASARLQCDVQGLMGGLRLGKFLGRFSMKRIVSARHFPIKTTGRFCEEQKKHYNACHPQISNRFNWIQLEDLWDRQPPPNRFVEIFISRFLVWNHVLEAVLDSLFFEFFSLKILFSSKIFQSTETIRLRFSSQRNTHRLHNNNIACCETHACGAIRPFQPQRPHPRLRGKLLKKKLESILIVFLFSAFVLLLLAVYF